MKEFWNNKKVFITGACGTVGSELIKQLIDSNASEITGIDNNENDLFFIDQKYRGFSNIHFYLCDIKNRDHLIKLCKGSDIVIHTAARKHVILNEIAPQEAINTNIIGTQNVIDAAIEAGISRVLFTSSDKAVNPTNVMGTSKLMGERLITAANGGNRKTLPIFSSTRFGNVLGSNGSVIPIFINQIHNGENITLTDERMSRFVMTKYEASKLVLESVMLAKGGEVFVTKMPVIMIKDLATAIINIYKDRGVNNNTEIEIIGAKPGEKMFEELISDEEVGRTIELGDFFSVLPAFKNIYIEADYNYTDSQKKVDRIYRSDIEKPMSVNEIQDYLVNNKLI